MQKGPLRAAYNRFLSTEYGRQPRPSWRLCVDDSAADAEHAVDRRLAKNAAGDAFVDNLPDQPEQIIRHPLIDLALQPHGREACERLAHGQNPCAQRIRKRVVLQREAGDPVRKLRGGKAGEIQPIPVRVTDEQTALQQRGRLLVRQLAAADPAGPAARQAARRPAASYPRKRPDRNT